MARLGLPPASRRLSTTTAGAALRESFVRDGYVVVPATLDTEEVAIVRETMERSSFLGEYEMSVENGTDGAAGKQTIYNFPARVALVPSSHPYPATVALTWRPPAVAGASAASTRVCCRRACAQGKGTLGALTRSERICGVADDLLGGDGVAHYFNKSGACP